MKRLLIGVGALIVLAVAAVLIAPSFVDWNRYKPEVAARVKEATGRDLVIDGDMSLSILPSPTLAVEKVRFANIEGGSAPDMATLESLDVRVALMPLLSGEIQVESVALVRPTILLETLADGRVNWDLAGAAEAPAAPSDASAGTGEAPDIRLDSVEIDDGTLIYRDVAAGTEERIEALSASITAESLQGPFKASGSARVRGMPVDFEAGSGALAPGHPLPLSISLSVPETDAKVTVTGTLQPAAEGADGTTRPASFDGKLQAGGPSLAKVIAALSPGTSMPAALADGFAIDSRIAYAAPLADMQELTLRLGETMARGAVTVDTSGPLFARAELKLNRIDVDKLLAAGRPAAAQPAGSADPAAPAAPDAATPAPAPAAAGSFSVPRNIGGELELAVDAIGYSGGVISDARLSAALSDGAIIITRASALLPGGSDLAIAGTIEAENGQPRFAGAVEASSDNLRGLLDWLKAPMPAGVESDRLRKLSMTTRVTATPASVQVADIDLRIDSSRVTGGIAIALPEAGKRAKPGFGIGLAVDKLNLDGYLGAVAAAAPAGAAEPTTATTNGAGAAPAANAGGLPLGALAPLAGFDANVELRVGSLTYHEQTMQGLHVDGTLQAGNLTLRDLSVQEFAGGKGALSGSFTDLAGDPRFDTRFDLSAGDAGRVLQFAGLDFPGRAKLGRLKLGGTLAGGRTDLAYDAAFSFGGIGAEGQAKGAVAGLGAGIPRVDTDLSLTAKDAGPLLELAGLAGAVDAKLGALSLTGKAASGTDDLTYDLSFSLSGVGGKGALAGRITAISSATPQVDTRLDISAEKPAGLLRLAGLDNATAGKLGALGVKGTMAGGADAMRLDLALDGLGGAAKVNGTVSAAPPAGGAAGSAGAPGGTTFDLTLDATHPELRQLLAAVAADYKPAGETLGAFHLATKATGSTRSANLTGLALDAGDNHLEGTVSFDATGARPMVVAALTGNSLDLRGLLPADGGSAGGASGGGAGGSSGGGGGSPWSREPLDLSALDAADADIDVAADAVILEAIRIDDAKAKLSLRDGILTVSSLTGSAYGGQINVTGQVAGRGVPSASGKIVATNLDSGELMKAGFLGSRVTGPLTLNADVKTVGVSMAEMMEGLNGTGQVGGTITVLTQVEQQVGSALLDLLGGKVKEVKGITDTVNGVFSAFAGAPNTLSGDFVITNGVLDTQNTELQNASARLLAQGQADLGGWTMDMLANIFRPPAESPYLTIGLNGILDSPNAKFSGDAISGRGAGDVLQQVVPGLGGATGTPGAGQTDGQTDGLGGVLQQVIPGLGGGQGAPEATAPSPVPTPDPAAPGALGTETAPAPEAAPAPAAEPEPAVPEAAEPDAAPAPAEEAAPAPEAAGPAAEPAPAEAVPEATPQEPATTDSAPADSMPADSMPAEPAPAEPEVTEPGVTEPGAAGTEPEAEEPAFIPPAEEEVPVEPQPEAVPPDAAAPDAATPDTAAPEAAAPEAVEPGTEPGAEEPDTAEPDAGEPGAAGAEPGAEGVAPEEIPPAQ